MLIVIRQEALNMALQRRKEQDQGNIALPAPTKRQSFVTRSKSEQQSNIKPQRTSSSFNIPPTNFQG